jgi:heat shock protein HslJ
MRLPAAHCLVGLIAGLVVAAGPAAFAAGEGFPDAGDYLLEAQPMKGLKRVPIFYVESQQEAAFSLWCNRVDAKLIVVGDTITIILSPPAQPVQCDSERMQADETLVNALQQVETWRRDGDVLVLQGGGEPLRFHLSSH